MKNQRPLIKKLFEDNPYQWIPLPELTRIAAQYGTRIFELRGQGMKILNTKKYIDGHVYTWFKYLPTDTNGQERFC